MTETNSCYERIQALVSMNIDDELAIINNLNQLVEEFGVEQVQSLYVSNSRHKNLLLHDLVRLGLSKVIEHAAIKLNFNVNLQRESDGNTPLHLAYWYKRPDIGEVLKRLQADTSIKNNYGETACDLEYAREKMMNIIWLDTGKLDYVLVLSDRLKPCSLFHDRYHLFSAQMK